MKQFKLKNLLIAAAILPVLASCHKDRVDPDAVTPQAERAGIYILNQGNFNANNSTLSYYDYTAKSFTADKFNAANNRGLGDTSNDVKIYGSKMYIIVNVSSTVEVVDAKTVKSIKQIKMENGTAKRQPRYIAFNGSKAYISLYDGNVAVLDTASLTVDTYIKVGRNPEQLAIANGKLYVANSGGLDFTNLDHTVSVVDLATQKEIKKIDVIANPISLSADALGNVYVLSAGDYGTTLPGLTVINSKTDVVSKNSPLAGAYGTSIIASGENVYFLTADNKVVVYNAQSQVVVQENFIDDGTVIETPYNLSVDTQTGEVFVCDAKDYSSNGAIFAFDKNGKKEYSITVGINPAQIVFINK
jgi:YVTN family beta-propeller protein